MVKHALRERLSSGVRPQVSGEAERLVHRQVGLDHEHGRAGDLHLLEHVASSPVQHAVDTSDGHLGALDLALVHGLHEARRCSQQTRVQAAPSRWNDLAATSVDGVGVQCHVVDVETYTTQVFFRQDT